MVNKIPGPLMKMQGVTYIGPVMEVAGPDRDKSIIIQGELEIGGKLHRMVGIRVKEAEVPGAYIADFLPGVTYGDENAQCTSLYARFSNLKALAGTPRPNAVEFMDAKYVFWIEPGER